jgi:hypothetical protein
MIQFDVRPNAAQTEQLVHAVLPLPVQTANLTSRLKLIDQQNMAVPAQFEIVGAARSGFAKGCLVDFYVDRPGPFTLIEAGEGSSEESIEAKPTVQVETESKQIHLSRVEFATSTQLLIRLRHESRAYFGSVEQWKREVNGPIRFSYSGYLRFFSDGTESPLVGSIRVHCFSRSGRVEIELMIRNPLAMDHPGGNWDLGAKGNVLIEDLSVDWQLSSAGASQFVHETELRASLNGGTSFQVASEAISILQASSGGVHWNSSNHLDRNSLVPMAFQGYEADFDGEPHRGTRAQPIVEMRGERGLFAVAYPKFWQNFPKVLSANQERIRIGLFPVEAGYPHELQGGEQKTFEFAMEWTSTAEKSQIAAVHRPANVNLAPKDFARLIAIPYLDYEPNDTKDPRYEALIRLAIEGDDSFFAKRELIDEYGWRHFGDVYGDHEAVFHNQPGNPALISHYNNQYDCTLGFVTQYLRSGDDRWLQMALEMADHAWDIDTYHTTEDKLLYNGGLFWHTYHYADADTSTHRSYPKRLLKADDLHKGKDLGALGETGKKLQKVYAVGGGPAAAHNYSTGWMYAYFLTGKERYREAAINAADYVMRIEDGSKTPFRWLCRRETGYSTVSSEGYYGPGRGSANSTLALLTGYDLTGDTKYLDRAVKLMYRTVHPEQNLPKLNLLNAELRWFYTMYLQALCRLIDTLEPMVERRKELEYAVCALLHFARWMVANEGPTLDRKEELQYPTETWCAQDIRKWYVLSYAAQWGSTELETRSLAEKGEFFYEYVMNTLPTFETKSLCRPVVLLMNYGWQANAFRCLPRKGFQRLCYQSWPTWNEFIPQKTIAMRRAKQLMVAGSLILGAVLSGILIAMVCVLR